MPRISFTVETDETDGSISIDFWPYTPDEGDPVGGIHIEHDGDNLLINVTRLDEAQVGSVLVSVH